MFLDGGLDVKVECSVELPLFWSPLPYSFCVLSDTGMATSAQFPKYYKYYHHLLIRERFTFPRLKKR